MSKQNNKKNEPAASEKVGPAKLAQIARVQNVKANVVAPTKALERAQPVTTSGRIPDGRVEQWQDVPHNKDLHGPKIELERGPRQHVEQRREGRGAAERMHVRGVEHVGIVRTSATGVVAGQSMLDGYPAGLLVNALMLGERLKLIARGYAKGRFTRFKVRYIPSVTQLNGPAGDFAIAYNVDPDAPLPDQGNDGFNALLSWADNSVCDRYVDHLTLDVVLELEAQAVNYIDSTGDDRFSAQGRVLIVAGDTNLAFPTGTMGHVLVEYEACLWQPNLSTNLSPTLLAIAPALGSGAAGISFLNGMQFAGSTEIVTSLGGVGASGPQFVLNAPSDILVSWMITMRGYGSTAGATQTSLPVLAVTGGQGYSPIAGWPVNYSDFACQPSPFEPLVSRQPATLNGFNIYGNPATFSIVNNFVGSAMWMFSTRSPVFLAFTAFGVSAGTTRCALTITRIDDDFQTRTRAHAPFLKVAQVQAIDYLVGDQTANLKELSGIVAKYVDDVDAGRESVNAIDLNYLSALHQAVGSPMPKAQKSNPHTPTTAPLFLPLLAGAASWFLSKFGPTIASSVLGYGVKKLTEYAEGKQEEPTRRERRRARKSRVIQQEEEEAPEV